MVKVRTYAAEKGSPVKERTIIDLEELETTDRYLLLNEAGGVLRVGNERVALTWPDLVLLAGTIAKTGVGFTKKTPT